MTGLKADQIVSIRINWAASFSFFSSLFSHAVLCNSDGFQQGILCDCLRR